jgi:hypothetical protein
MIEEYNSMKASNSLPGQGGVLGTALDTIQNYNLFADANFQSLPPPLPHVNFGTFDSILQAKSMLEQYFESNLLTRDKVIKIPTTEPRKIVFRDWVILYLLVCFYIQHGAISSGNSNDKLLEQFLDKFEKKGEKNLNNPTKLGRSLRKVVGGIVLYHVEQGKIKNLADINKYQDNPEKFLEEKKEHEQHVREEFVRKNQFSESQKVFFGFTQDLETIATAAREESTWWGLTKSCQTSGTYCEYSEPIPFVKFEDLSTDEQWKQHSAQIDKYYKSSITSWNQVVDWFIQYLLLRYTRNNNNPSKDEFLKTYQFSSELRARQFRDELKGKLEDIFAYEIPKDNSALVQLVNEKSMDKLHVQSFAQFTDSLHAIAKQQQRESSMRKTDYEMWISNFDTGLADHQSYFENNIVKRRHPNWQQMTDWLIHYMILEYRRHTGNPNVIDFVSIFASKEYIRPRDFRKYVESQITPIKDKKLFVKFSRIENFIHFLLKNKSGANLKTHIQQYTPRVSLEIQHDSAKNIVQHDIPISERQPSAKILTKRQSSVKNLTKRQSLEPADSDKQDAPLSERQSSVKNLTKRQSLEPTDSDKQDAPLSERQSSVKNVFEQTKQDSYKTEAIAFLESIYKSINTRNVGYLWGKTYNTDIPIVSLENKNRALETLRKFFTESINPSAIPHLIKDWMLVFYFILYYVGENENNNSIARHHRTLERFMGLFCTGNYNKIELRDEIYTKLPKPFVLKDVCKIYNELAEVENENFKNYSMPCTV